MAGRHDAAIAAALQAVAQAVGNHSVVEDAASRSLATFQRESPPTFKGGYDPDGAWSWMREMERIFRVMDCSAVQKVRFGTHMLAEEADDWWLGHMQVLEASGEEITWVVFKREFLRKYFPEDVRGKKELEFLKLEQGKMSVAEYAAKFVELAKFYPPYMNGDAEFSKCVKFENGLRHDIKKAMGYHKIRVFAELVDRSRIYEEDSNASYKIVNEKRNSQYRNKPYEVSGGKGEGKEESGSGKRPSRGDASASVVCFKCGLSGHKRSECRVGDKKCYKCGKEGHKAADCEKKEIVCFNCGEVGHISPKCPKPKKEKGSGKVFALDGSEAAGEA